MPDFKKITIDRFLVCLVSICILVIASNYTSGTLLSGWDTLHPEFDMAMYWKRITHVWQEHQGLGSPPTQSHAAEIPRMMIYGVLDGLLPMTMVRYSYIWLMIILGPMGVYYFLLFILKKSGKTGTSAHIGAFLGGLFYLLNVGTVQHFLVILEMFATKWGYLGFIFLFLSQYLDTGRKKWLFWLTIVLIFSAPMSHTATLWYVFFIGYVGYTIFYTFLYGRELPTWKQRFPLLKRSGLALFLVVILNLYWILPNVYYSFFYSQDIIYAKINRLFSEEAYLNNRYFGNINDLLLFKNFLFNWYIGTPSITPEGYFGQPVYTQHLLQAWITHLTNPFVLLIAYLLSLSGIAGAGYGIYKRNKVIICLAPVTLGCGFFMLASTPIMSTIIEWLRSQSLLLKELLRFPFTKMSIYYIFGICIYFGYLMTFAAERVSRWGRNKHYAFSLFTYIVSFCIIVYALPALQGNFISQILRVKLPFEYDLMFKRFGRDDNGRILMLPINSLYGWQYYQWNVNGQPQIYQGGGFTWFGFNQPTLNREFDRWYYPNEEAFREFSYALYSKNGTLFRDLLHKYNIHWLVLDENVTSPGGETEYKKLFYPETKELLKSMKGITFNYQFGEHIGVYSVDDNQKKPQVTVLTQYNRVYPPYRWNYLDYPYAVGGDYISPDYDSKTDTPSGPALPSSIIYPMRGMLDNKERVNKDLLHLTKTDYTFTAKTNATTPGSFRTPPIEMVEKSVPARLLIDSETKELSVRYLLPYPKNQTAIQEHVSIPVTTTQLIVRNTLFNLPAQAGKNQIIGDTLVDTTQPLQIETVNAEANSTISSLTLDKLTHPIQEHSPSLTLTSPIFAAEGYNVTLEEIAHASRDCGITPSAISNKRIRFDENGQGIAIYETTNGTICDKLNFKDAIQNTGYILAIESRNDKGLPLRICVEEPLSRQCVLEDELSKFDHWDTDYFIIPPYMRQQGYNVTIQNVSIGQAPTMNETRSIRLIPFTYNWLQSLGYVPDGYKPHVGSAVKPVVNVDKRSPTRYEVNVQNIGIGDVIALDEAYEHGWQAYAVNGLLGRLFPPLFGSPVGKHIMVNNWANGWEIDQNDVGRLNDSQIVLYYVPQYLLWIGIIVLVVSLMVIVRPVYVWRKYGHLLRHLT